MELSENVEVFSVEPHREERSLLSRRRTILPVAVDLSPSLARRVEKPEERREPDQMRIREAAEVVGEFVSKPAFHVRERQLLPCDGLSKIVHLLAEFLHVEVDVVSRSTSTVGEQKKAESASRRSSMRQIRLTLDSQAEASRCC